MHFRVGRCRIEIWRCPQWRYASYVITASHDIIVVCHRICSLAPQCSQWTQHWLLLFTTVASNIHPCAGYKNDLFLFRKSSFKILRYFHFQLKLIFSGSAWGTFMLASHAVFKTLRRLDTTWNFARSIISPCTCTQLVWAEKIRSMLCLFHRNDAFYTKVCLIYIHKKA